MADHAFNRHRFITVTGGTITIDDTDPVDMNVDEIAGVAITIDQGNSTANTQRVVIADDDTNLAAINTGTNPELFHNLFTLKSAALMNLKPNHIRAELAVVTFMVDANKGVEFSSHIDGALVGGASLNYHKFSKIVETAYRVQQERSLR